MTAPARISSFRRGSDGRAWVAVLEMDGLDAVAEACLAACEAWIVDGPEGPVGVVAEARLDDRGHPLALVVSIGTFGGSSVDVPVELVVEMQIDKQRLVLAEHPGEPSRGLRAFLQRLA